MHVCVPLSIPFSILAQWKFLYYDNCNNHQTHNFNYTAIYCFSHLHLRGKLNGWTLGLKRVNFQVDKTDGFKSAHRLPLLSSWIFGYMLKFLFSKTMQDAQTTLWVWTKHGKHTSNKVISISQCENQNKRFCTIYFLLPSLYII